MVFYLYFRGDCFRREFSRLGELRSVIPENVNVMALTATATVSTRREIMTCKNLLLCQFLLLRTIFSSVHLQEDLLAYLYHQLVIY